jgi:hypothetical protein
MTRIPDLERELVSAAQRQQRRRRGVAFRGRALAIAAAATLAAGGLAAATATNVFDREPPTPEAVDAYQPQGPVAFVAEVDDPHGPPWMLRSWGQRGGDPCVQPGHRTDDRFGLLFEGNPADQRFRPLSYTDGPACGPGAVQAVHLLDRLGSPRARLATTLVYGILPEGLGDGKVRLTVNGSPWPVAQSQRAYLGVLDGGVARSALRVSFAGADTDTELADFGRSDPPDAAASIVNLQEVEGNAGLSWAQRVRTRADGARCAVTGQFVAGLVGALMPGLPGAFVEAPSDEANCAQIPRSGDRSWPATLNVRTQPADPNVTSSEPARGFLVLAGVAAPEVQSVRVVSGDETRQAALDAQSR